MVASGVAVGVVGAGAGVVAASGVAGGGGVVGAGVVSTAGGVVVVVVLVAVSVDGVGVAVIDSLVGSLGSVTTTGVSDFCSQAVQRPAARIAAM